MQRTSYKDNKMTIIKNTKIRERWCHGFKRSADQVKEIVIHATAGLGTIKWMETSDERKEQWSKGIGLFHFLIDRQGQVTEVIDPEFYVFHSSSGQHDLFTIGIELEKSKSNNSDVITLEQSDSLLSLIKQLCMMYPNISKIVSHDYNAKTFSNRPPKPCPGAFPVESFVAAVGGLNLGRKMSVIL
jgi:N-acetyl-anhydromuramyl-L-alanine amidase AmpD